MSVERVCKINGFGLKCYVSKRKTIKKYGKNVFVEILIPDPSPMQIIKFIQKRSGGTTYAGNPLPTSHWVGMMLSNFNLMERKYGEGIGKTYKSKVTPERFIEILEERNLIHFEKKEIIPIEAMNTKEKEDIKFPSADEVMSKLYKDKIIKPIKKKEKSINTTQRVKTIESNNSNKVKQKDVNSNKNNSWGFDV